MQDESDKQAFLMLQGAKAVKEELLDDIIKESGPYRPPGKVLARRDGYGIWCMYQIAANKFTQCVMTNFLSQSVDIF